jgi:DDE superfamily endonuclease
MQAMLDELAQAVSPGAHAVVLMDRVGWHTARELDLPANLTPAFLPAYSPELNAIERVWLYLRERFLSHRLWPSYDDILAACCAAWKALLAETGRIRSLCALDWARSVVNATGISRGTSSTSTTMALHSGSDMLHTSNLVTSAKAVSCSNSATATSCSGCQVGSHAAFQASPLRQRHHHQGLFFGFDQPRRFKPWHEARVLSPGDYLRRAPPAKMSLCWRR